MADAVSLPAPNSRESLGSAELARLLALLLPAGLLGGALFSQFVGHLYPCEMCIWQRWPHGVAILLALAAFTAPATNQRSRNLTLAAAFCIAVSGIIGAYHAGVEAKVFKGFTMCTATASGLSNADLLRQITQTPLIQCDQVQWSLWGISLAGWNAIFSLSGAALILYLVRKGMAR